MTRRTSRFLLGVIRGLMLGCFGFAVCLMHWRGRFPESAVWAGALLTVVAFAASVLWWRAQRNLSDDEPTEPK